MAREFFIGLRLVEEAQLNYHKGKATLLCALWEEWREILSRQVRCGATFTKKVSRKQGVEVSEIEALESTLTSSIGCGIAKVGSQLKGSLKTEVTIHQAVETTEELKFAAPKCGRYSALVYQLYRHWSFQFKDDRFLHKASWTKMLTEPTEDYHDASKKTENDPDCGCSMDADAGVDGQLYLDAGRVGIVAGFIAGNNRLVLPRLRHEFSGSFLAAVEPVVTLDPARLPEYLRFFIGSAAPIRARVARYEEQWGPDSLELKVEQPALDLLNLQQLMERRREMLSDYER